ncbi:MAG: hypothetical protein P4N41_01835 [Negativicutes bacterium]|nr:hypothetical protein [Negativicutes bacterium]
MRTKEEYYRSVLENRKIAAEPENLKCTCSQTLCEWHGRCRECVALHRYYQDHVPACLHSFINDKISQIAGITELDTVAREKTPPDYREYVRARDNKHSQPLKD